MEYAKRGRRSPSWSADRVRALRRHMGLTQQQLSEELGTRQQTISEWETGMYRPRGASHTLLNMVAERAGFEYGSSAQGEGDAEESTDDKRPG